MARRGGPRHPRTPLLNNLALVHVFISDVLQDIAFPPEDVVGDVVNLRTFLEDVVTNIKYIYYIYIYFYSTSNVFRNFLQVFDVC